MVKNLQSITEKSTKRASLIGLLFFVFLYHILSNFLDSVLYIVL